MDETRGKKDDDNVVFYYNREARLSKASDNARFMADHYRDEQTGKRRGAGFFKSMLATRASRVMFISIIGLAVFMFVYQGATKPKGKAAVAGSVVTAEAMWFDGAAYVTVRRSSLKRGAVPVALEITVSDGAAGATGVMSASEDELKLKFVPARRPKSIAVEALAGDERAAFVAPVD